MNPSGGGLTCHELKNENEKLNIFEEIISLENLFLVWHEFKRGKTNKPDVQEFAFNLEGNLFDLHRELKNKIYRHSYYIAFNICDPKLRRIHKACVRDRVLYPIFDKSFIFDSYSCRLGKGTHRAVNRLEKFCRKLSKNNTKNIFALKCDIRKFFDSVDQNILMCLVERKIQNKDTLWLIEIIIKSFEKSHSKGLPLGNVTSQLLANIYLNELDQFIKHSLRAKYYLRYCDDFVILSSDKNYLAGLVSEISCFLKERLNLSLHSDKVMLRKYHQGIGFVGYIVLPHYRVLRTNTKKRIITEIKVNCESLKNSLVSREYFEQSLQSYLGVLKHCCGHKIEREIFSVIGVD